MACGLPVLASNQGGLREIVLDTETGYLLPAGDASAWQQALAQVTGAEQQPRLGAAGHERAERYFTWSKNAQNLLNALLQFRTRSGKQA
jgi:glycosyltransferase involved in cell wall biosynthesis